MFEQDRIIVRLQQRVNAETKIVACFLSGSYGRRQEDAYSDLDVALVFATDGDREAAWRERRSFVQSVNPYVPVKSFDAAHVRPFFHIALHANGAKVDYRFETQAEITANPWDKDLRILKDTPDGWAAQYQAACARTPLVQPTLSAVDLKKLDDRFWVMFMDVFRLLLRGEHDKPFTVYLELLHFHLPPLLNVLPPEEPARAGLLAAYFGRDVKTTRQKMVDLLQAYVAARTAVVNRLHLDFTPNTRFENEIMQLVKRKA